MFFLKKDNSLLSSVCELTINIKGIKNRMNVEGHIEAKCNLGPRGAESAAEEANAVHRAESD